MGLILVDSSVWIDLFGPKVTLQTEQLLRFLSDEQPLAVGDLIVTEVLQGTRSERAFRQGLAFLTAFDRVAIVDDRVALEAARNYRRLRTCGVTARSTIDTLIATRCILDRIPLLYSDRDFDPFVEHLGLISAMSLPGAQ